MGSVQSQWETISGLTPKLLDLHATKKHSTREMAAQLSKEFKITLTRNAVISKLRRLGLTQEQPPRKAKVKPKPPAPPPKPKPKRERVVHFTYTPPPKDMLPVGLSVTLFDLDDSMCKYPTSEIDEPYRFCGLPVCSSAEPYCCEHSQIVHYPPVSHRIRQ